MSPSCAIAPDSNDYHLMYSVLISWTSLIVGGLLGSGQYYVPLVFIAQYYEQLHICDYTRLYVAIVMHGKGTMF